MAGVEKVVTAVGEDHSLAVGFPSGALFHQIRSTVKLSHRQPSLAADADQEIYTTEMQADPVMEWLLAGDPAIRWQTLRDLQGAGVRTIAREQGRVARELLLTESSAVLDVELKTDRTDSQTLNGLRAFAHDVRLDGQIVRLRVKSEDVVPEIARWLVGQGVGIHAIGSRRKSLEEWFIEVMGEDQRPG